MNKVWIPGQGIPELASFGNGNTALGAKNCLNNCLVSVSRDTALSSRDLYLHSAGMIYRTGKAQSQKGPIGVVFFCG